MDNQQSVFNGLRVLDLSEDIAGPIVGMFLADYGADVVKIELPKGDPARSEAGFAMWNRGKRSVVVDPARPEQLQWLARHVAAADVIVSRGQSQLAQFGLDKDTLVLDHPHLVIAELPPYLPDYTPWAGGREHAQMLAAHGGVAWRQSSVSGCPVDSVYPMLQYTHGLWATVCTVAALIERQGSGHGQCVTVTGVNALTQLALPFLGVNPDAQDADTAIGPAGRHPLYTRVLAADGKWLAVGGLGMRHETAVIRELGLEYILDDPRLNGVLSNMFAGGNLEWIKSLVDKAFLTKTREQWLQAFDNIGVACGPVDDRDQWLDLPQNRITGVRAETTDPERGAVVMPGIFATLTQTPGDATKPAPTLGQHTQDDDLWPQRTQTPTAARPPVRPGPLSGLTILNCGSYVAAPYAGGLLAELGANVVKVESPAGDPFRASAYAVNGGVRSLAVNLKADEGRDTIHTLAKSADALIEGLRPGVASALGIDFDTLSTINPSLVTMSLSAYGQDGPMSARGGFDMILQGECGLMLAEGGEDEPVVTTIAIIDMTTSAVIALGVCLALYAKQQTGTGQRTWTSLAATSAFLQCGELVRFDGRVPPPIGGRDHVGRVANNRMYPVADGWIRIAPPTNQDATEAIETALELTGLDLTNNPAATDKIAHALSSISGRQAVETLNTAGIPAVTVRKVSQVLRDPHLLESEFLHVYKADDDGFLCGAGQFATFSRTGRYGLKIPPGIGEHSVEVLTEGGVDTQQITALIDAGTILQGEPIERIIPLAYR